jgi:hypothetical protein
MSDVFRTMIITAADAQLVRAIADMFAGSPQHMWQTGLSTDGKAPATHYIATGYVPEGYQAMAPWQEWKQNPETGQWVMVDSYPGRPDIVFGACQQPIPDSDPPQPKVPCTLAQVEGAFQRSDMTSQDPWVALGRLGLQIVQPEPMPVPQEIDPDNANPSF